MNVGGAQATSETSDSLNFVYSGQTPQYPPIFVPATVICFRFFSFTVLKVFTVRRHHVVLLADFELAIPHSGASPHALYSVAFGRESERSLPVEPLDMMLHPEADSTSRE